ncbi:GspH/FimT family pseudopilin [Luteimonas sp. SJ-92]|uniref:Type II secretion system protein H n=1 Tax=Luteimonas salinisoli TaxID=2752307 RepID=A0A853JCE1_9GAMM|nr:GspH/FimT family pseudopilin [Luteimonas salinisoli]NZA26299.1 GspH/FimT family pseudopilin [Luteimonas salinisoli]
MRQRGFTLVELMVTVAIVAILLAVGLPSFQGSMRSNRVATATNELVAALSLARSEALRSPGGAFVCTTEDGVDCGGGWADGWMVVLDYDGNELPGGANDRVMRYVAGNDKLEIVADSAGGATYENMIRFDSRGRTVDHAVELELQPADCPSGHELVRTIDITPTGQVKTRKSACT